MKYKVHAPIRPEVRKTMQDWAARFGKELPERMGFALLVFDFGEGGFMNYISNSNREDMIKALEEFLLTHGIIAESEKVKIIESIDKEVEDSVTFAKESPYPDERSYLNYVFKT